MIRKIKKNTWQHCILLMKQEHIELQEKFNNSKMCVGIIMIDNYEEIMHKEFLVKISQSYCQK